MYIGTYKIAELTLQIRSLYRQVQDYCKDYRWEGPGEVTITTDASDICREQEKSDRENRLEGKPPVEYSPEYLEILAVYRKLADILVHRDTLLFHGSAIAVDGRGVLFTAKSGMGKSTHTRLWRQAFGQRVVTVNDDKPLLKLTPAQVLVCGTPWDGKHRISTNCILPLEAICILERGTENEIWPITPREALPMLLQQCHRPDGAVAMARMMELIDGMISHLRFYRLRCNMDPQAPQVAYGGIFGE